MRRDPAVRFIRILGRQPLQLVRQCAEARLPVRRFAPWSQWCLPLSLRNILRIVEHYVRALVDRFKIESDRNVSAISPDTFAGHNYSRILIIDDATDSGDTLSAVHLFIEQKFPASDIRFGVLTQTRRHMSKVPDYSLFKSVLIRFPWSNDFHAGDATSDNFIRLTLGA